MACGTPALVGAETAAGCPAAGALLPREAVGSADTVDRWAARLEAMVAQPATLAGMRAPVAEFARRQWSWAHCVERYAALLRACAACR
jgi:hypothetical protein